MTYASPLWIHVSNQTNKICSRDETRKRDPDWPIFGKTVTEVKRGCNAQAILTKTDYQVILYLNTRSTGPPLIPPF